MLEGSDQLPHATNPQPALALHLVAPVVAVLRLEPLRKPVEWRSQFAVELLEAESLPELQCIRVRAINSDGHRNYILCCEPLAQRP